MPIQLLMCGVCRGRGEVIIVPGMVEVCYICDGKKFNEINCDVSCPEVPNLKRRGDNGLSKNEERIQSRPRRKKDASQ